MEFLTTAFTYLFLTFLFLFGIADLLDAAWRLLRWLGIAEVVEKAWAAWVRALTWPALIGVWIDTAAAWVWGFRLLERAAPKESWLGLLLICSPLFALAATVGWRRKVQAEDVHSTSTGCGTRALPPLPDPRRAG